MLLSKVATLIQSNSLSAIFSCAFQSPNWSGIDIAVFASMALFVTFDVLMSLLVDERRSLLQVEGKTWYACVALFIFKESSFHLLVTKNIFSHISFQNLSSHYVVGVRLFHLAPVRNTVKNIQFMATSPYYNPTTYTSG